MRSKYHWKPVGKIGLEWNEDEDTTARIVCFGYQWYWHLLIGHVIVARGDGEDFPTALSEAEKAIGEHVSDNDVVQNNIKRAKKTIDEFLAAQESETETETDH